MGGFFEPVLPPFYMGRYTLIVLSRRKNCYKFYTFALSRGSPE